MRNMAYLTKEEAVEAAAAMERDFGKFGIHPVWLYLDSYGVFPPPTDPNVPGSAIYMVEYRFDTPQGAHFIFGHRLGEDFGYRVYFDPGVYQRMFVEGMVSAIGSSQDYATLQTSGAEGSGFAYPVI